MGESLISRTRKHSEIPPLRAPLDTVAISNPHWSQNTCLPHSLAVQPLWDRNPRNGERQTEAPNFHQLPTNSHNNKTIRLFGYSRFREENLKMQTRSLYESTAEKEARRAKSEPAFGARAGTRLWRGLGPSRPLLTRCAPPAAGPPRRSGPSSAAEPRCRRIAGEGGPAPTGRRTEQPRPGGLHRGAEASASHPALKGEQTAPGRGGRRGDKRRPALPWAGRLAPLLCQGGGCLPAI